MCFSVCASLKVSVLKWPPCTGAHYAWEPGLKNCFTIFVSKKNTKPCNQYHAQAHCANFYDSRLLHVFPCSSVLARACLMACLRLPVAVSSSVTSENINKRDNHHAQAHRANFYDSRLLLSLFFSFWSGPGSGHGAQAHTMHGNLVQNFAP